MNGLQVSVETLAHMLTLLNVTDIMLVVYILEALYQLSELGTALCERLISVPRLVGEPLQWR